MPQPKYRLLEKAFFEPHHLLPGTVIFWTGEPGPHMEPLNEEAHAAMEEYYQRKPQARFGLNVVEGLAGPISEAGPTPEMTFVSAPPAPDPKERALSVAEMSDKSALATDQRPKPLVVSQPSKEPELPEGTVQLDPEAIAAAAAARSKDAAAAAELAHAEAITKQQKEAAAKAEAEQKAQVEAEKAKAAKQSKSSDESPI